VDQINVVGVDAMTHDSLFDNPNQNLTAKEKFKSSFSIGNRCEKLFKQCCNQNNLNVIGSNNQQDMLDHYDFKVINPKTHGSRLVDVKAIKNINRYDEKTNLDFTLIEFKNVNGNKGWLEGKADYIGFEKLNGFLMVNRKILRDYCISKMYNKNQVMQKPYVISDPQNSTYQFFTRKGRKDKFIYIPFKDLYNIEDRWTLNYK
jgi:hypothetical protein